MINFKSKSHYDFDDLVQIMGLLRGPEGCPWDREQTHESIRRNFIEEVYEALDAIDRKDDANLREELGDVMMQVVFHARIAQEAGRFDMNDVTDQVCKKLIHRHPHIFGTVSADTADEVVKNWDAIKRVEKGQKDATQTLREVPRSLPALLYADKLQGRAKKGGLAWPDAAGALQELEEEAARLRRAAESGQDVEEALGGLLFAAVHVGRLHKADPEEALYRAAQRYMERFAYIERNAAAPLDSLSRQEYKALWKQAEKQEAARDGSGIIKEDI